MLDESMVKTLDGFLGDMKEKLEEKQAIKEQQKELSGRIVEVLNQYLNEKYSDGHTTRHIFDVFVPAVHNALCNVYCSEMYNRKDEQDPQKFQRLVFSIVSDDIPEHYCQGLSLTQENMLKLLAPKAEAEEK